MGPRKPAGTGVLVTGAAGRGVAAEKGTEGVAEPTTVGATALVRGVITPPADGGGATGTWVILGVGTSLLMGGTTPAAVAAAVVVVVVATVGTVAVDEPLNTLGVVLVAAIGDGAVVAAAWAIVLPLGDGKAFGPPEGGGTDAAGGGTRLAAAAVAAAAAAAAAAAVVLAFDFFARSAICSLSYTLLPNLLPNKRNARFVASVTASFLAFSMHIVFCPWPMP